MKLRRANPLKHSMSIRTSEAFVFILLAMSGSALGQNLPQGAGESAEDHLAREVNDPTAILAQLQFQDLYTPRYIQTSAQTNTIQLRPYRADRSIFRLPFQQVVRPTFQVRLLATSSSSSTITEFTDMELFDLFVSNWPNPKETGFGGALDRLLCFRREEIRRLESTPGKMDPRPQPNTSAFRTCWSASSSRIQYRLGRKAHGRRARSVQCYRRSENAATANAAGALLVELPELRRAQCHLEILD